MNQSAMKLNVPSGPNIGVKPGGAEDASVASSPSVMSAMSFCVIGGTFTMRPSTVSY
jgi:hypothetical protein